MTPKTFIFIGRSGSGKGTQAKLLEEYLKKLDPKRKALYIQSGQEFREFIKGETTTQKLSKELYDGGVLQPEFLAIFMWVNVLVKQYTAGEHLILDGMPRKYHEAGVLDSIFSFYKLESPYVIYLDISKEEAIDRLMKRGRFDDVYTEIEDRLAWFESDVLPTLDFFRNNPDYTFIKVNGQGSVEETHKQTLELLKLS